MKYIPPFFVVFLLFVYGCSTQNTSKDNFNIVLITIDTLRADHLSCYGYERETSPNIDKIAKKGILFKNVIAPSSWTAPSMVSLFTSTYPINHGVIHGLASQKARGFSQEIFSEKLATLPEMLKKQGYTTFGVASNHLLTATFGFARGFDYFKCVDWKTADQINSIVYTWGDKIKKAKKYFLWMHYIDPHIPYHPRSPWIDQYISGDKKFKPLLARYDSEINYVDSYVGELIERFKLDKNTLLIITSDHGEQFLEHGRMRHSNNLHKEELHVPLIIKFPDISKMESIERQVSLLDVMPTILNALNTDQPEQTLGKPLMDNGGILSCLKKMLLSRRESRYNFAELDSNTTLKAIITPKWKYIYNYKNRSEQLYNIITDPLEQKNLLDKNIKLGNNLKGQLLQWVLHAKTYPPKSHLFQLSQEEIEKLQTLGYLTGQKYDEDNDGIINEQDNCVEKPNGPMQGMCTSGYIGKSCTNNDQCGVDGFCSTHQEDADGDRVGDLCDNCLEVANSSQEDTDEDGLGDVCDLDDDNDGLCDPSETDSSCTGSDNCQLDYNPNQEDTYPPQGNNIGDACDCEGDFNCDGSINAEDTSLFLKNFDQRKKLGNPCTNKDQCTGDFDCDGDVDENDRAIFLEDFGRSQYNNPCPACVVGDWCVY